MANDVFANGREIACKKAGGKSTCSFPDVCFTPPQTPATPPGVPLPYPNTAYAKDTKKGSKNVKISKNEVMLKNKSYFKKSVGNEPGRAPKKGFVTSKNKGKGYFNSWSPNVKVEKKNVVRHFDIMTQNHGSFPGNTPTWPYIDTETTKGQGCAKERKQVEDNCPGDQEKYCGNSEEAKKCQKAKKCMLVPYSPVGNQTGCCPGLTPHHLIEVHCFKMPGKRSSTSESAFVNSDFKEYRPGKAPCVCVKGTRYTGEHGELHAIQNTHEKQCMDPNGKKSQMGGANGAWNYGKAKEGAVKAHQTAFPNSGADGKACSKDCIEKQLDNYHQEVGVKDDKTELRADRSPLKEEQKEWGKQQLARIGP